jgi:xanthine dehydrogenase accessory factor
MKPSVIIRIIKAEGSTPREVGASMLVTADGFRGTIGGGTLEWHALAEAQKMLGQPKATKQIQKHLGPDLGQCCGGRVTLAFENFSAEDQPLFKADENKKTHINLWGAGHVGRALVMALAPLPFDVTWWDVRDNAFPTLTPENTTCRIGTPTDMQTGGLVLVMTHSHALDFEIVDYALRNKSFTHVGLIGSSTKQKRFLKRLTEAGHDANNLAKLTCPIGQKSITSKHPAVIAASVAVQLLEWKQAIETQHLQTSPRARATFVN